MSPPGAEAATSCSGGKPTISGTPGADVLTGTNDFDVIRGGGDDDRIDGGGGGDFICAGPGDDVVEGGPGNDNVRLGGGDDASTGGDGDDLALGQGGHDSADGGLGVDTCRTEAIQECETNLDMIVVAFPPPPDTAFKGGGGRVYTWPGGVFNLGPSTALSPYAVISLPAEAEFVPDQPFGACREGPVDQIICATGAIEPDGFGEFRLSVRFPDCPLGQSTVTVSAFVDDLYTNDPFPFDDTFRDFRKLAPDASCQP